MQSQSKTFAIIALIGGIIALLLFCIPVVALILALIGTIFGIFAVVRSTRSNEPTGLPISGMVISILALIIAIFYNFYIFKSTFDGGNKFWNNNYNFQNNTDSSSYDINPDNIDTNNIDFDSAFIDNKELNDLNNTNSDKTNGPGNPPK